MRIPILTGLCLVSYIFAATPPEVLVERGKEAYRNSHWEEAATWYQLAADRDQSPEVRFNLGASLYKAANYSQAARAFEQAAAAAHGRPLETKSKLGLANCEYRLAMELPVRERVKKLQLLMVEYAALVPLEDAAFNLEVVRRRLASLESQAPRNGSQEAKAPSALAKDIVQSGQISAARGGRQRVDRDW